MELFWNLGFGIWRFASGTSPWEFEFSRRAFLAQGVASAGALTVAGLPAFAEGEKKIYPQGKAEHCIFLWLGGGCSHTDTWDPKRLGDPQKKIAGSAYPAIDTAIRGVQVCEHLKATANLLDRLDRKSTRLNSSHVALSRMPSSA